MLNFSFSPSFVKLVFLYCFKYKEIGLEEYGDSKQDNFFTAITWKKNSSQDSHAHWKESWSDE